MALLDETNLAAERVRAAQHRTNHVGTKLNAAELKEFVALAAPCASPATRRLPKIGISAYNGR